MENCSMTLSHTRYGFDVNVPRNCLSIELQGRLAKVEAKIGKENGAANKEELTDFTETQASITNICFLRIGRQKQSG